MTREVLPNALPPLIAEFGLRFCFAFLFLSALSFLGLGIQPPQADWGGMVRDNANAISFGLIVPLIPAAAIALLTIRSEEHTSELQSLMRISYAVFCLKKKKTHITNTYTNSYHYTRKRTY